MARPMIVALEGPDGSGKTQHARALAEALTRAGIPAKPWHHPKPSTSLQSPWSTAAHYALERAHLANELAWRAHEDLRVLVVDRWWLSTQMLGLALDNDALASLAEAECRQLGHPALTVVLTAPDELLNARLNARREYLLLHDYEVRRDYESHARVAALPVVDTSGTPETVTERLVELVREVLP